MSATKICILGGTGFVGRSLAARLLQHGYHVTIITRRRERHRDLLVLPGLELLEGDVHEMGLLRTVFQGMNAVINLVGILNENGFSGDGFKFAHAELAGKVLEACKQTGVTRVLHMSALHADPKGPSHYLRTKGEAENLMHRDAGELTQVTSFRPSVIFGPGDSFFNRFAKLLRDIPWLFPLACPDAKLQPVYAGDVVGAMVSSLHDHKTYGQRYDLCGPRVYTLRELVAYTAAVTGVRRYILGLNPWQSRLQAAAMEFIPGKPFSRDNYNSLQIDNVCEGPFPAVFGITPSRIEEVVPGYLQPRSDRLTAHRKQARRD